MLPDPILQLGKIKVHMYGVMIAVGILCAFIVLYTYGKKLKLNTKFLDFIYYDAIAAILLGFGSSALFQSLYNFIENPEAGFKLGNKASGSDGISVELFQILKDDAVKVPHSICQQIWKT